MYYNTVQALYIYIYVKGISRWDRHFIEVTYIEIGKPLYIPILSVSKQIYLLNLKNKCFFIKRTLLYIILEIKK